MGAAVLRFGLVLPSGCASYAPRKEAFQALDAKTAAIVDALADAMVDAGLPLPSSLGIAGRIDGMVAALHPDIKLQTMLLFNVFEHFPLVFEGTFKRFTHMDAAARRAYLHGWASSRLEFRRMAFQALKMFVYVNYYSFTETWVALGYDGPWVGRFEIPAYEPPLAKYTDKEPL